MSYFRGSPGASIKQCRDPKVNLSGQAELLQPRAPARQRQNPAISHQPLFKQLQANIAKLFLVIIESDKKVRYRA